MYTKCTEDNITEKLGFYKGLINDETVIYPYYENVTEEFMQQIWKYTAKLDGVILNDAWPLDESLKNHNDTFDILPYFNKVRLKLTLLVVVFLFLSQSSIAVFRN